MKFFKFFLGRGGRGLAWIAPRPAHCDRGRWYANVEAPMWRSDADPWPRYYFDLERAKLEIEAYLSAKQIDVTGAAWVETEA